MKDRMVVIFSNDPRNESFARMVVSGFMARINPTMEQLNDVKTAISEAVTNCIVHAYGTEYGEIEIEGSFEGAILTLKVKDTGIGISDIAAAREPLYTTRPEEERSGMGFSFMEIFMDSLEIISTLGAGTTIIMTKNLGEK